MRAWWPKRAQTRQPDRVIVGTDNPRTAELLKALYDPFTRNRERMIVMDIGITESLPKDALKASSVTSTSTATWRTRSWWASLALCLACNAFG